MSNQQNLRRVSSSRPLKHMSISQQVSNVSVNTNIVTYLKGSDFMQNSSDDEEMRDRLLPSWMASKLNTKAQQIMKNHGQYLWAFGQNEKRALSVEKNKGDQINSPKVSRITLSNSQDRPTDDKVIQVATADEHSACVTQNGRIFMVGSNHHQQLGL